MFTTNDSIKEWEDMRKKHYNGEISYNELMIENLSHPRKFGQLRKQFLAMTKKFSRLMP